MRFIGHLLIMLIIGTFTPAFAADTEWDIANYLKDDLDNALNGTSYFDSSDSQSLYVSMGVDKINHVDVELNMTSNTSDSERASKIVFETLFKNPQVLGVDVQCSFNLGPDRFGIESMQWLNSYSMDRVDAEAVENWSALDLSRYTR
ncbi:MAG: hypothetical protein WCW68_01605 [Methanothrix sp.]|jgi:hypothetical protein